MVLFDSITDYVALAGLALILAPVLVFGGLYIALFLGAVFLLVVKGIPFALEFLKERHSGAAAAKKAEKLTERRWNR